MSRTTKRASSGAIFTSSERKLMEGGSSAARLEAGSIKELDACGLCLHTAVSPMACPDGHLYCRKCILESLLEQASALQRQMEVYRAETELKRAAEVEAQEEAQAKRVAEFEQMDMGVGSSRGMEEEQGGDGTGSGDREGREPAYRGTFYGEAKFRSVKQRTEEEVSEKELLSSNDPNDPKKLRSFWLPSLTPQAESGEVERPKLVTQCPAGGHALKRKKLIEVHFSCEEGDGEEVQDVQYQCPVCLKQFRNQARAVLLKRCGHVFCHSCASQFCTSSCYTCSGKVKGTKDWIELQGRSGFAGGKRVLHVVKASAVAKE